MTLEEKEQDIIDEFAIYDDWIRESTAFEDRGPICGSGGRGTNLDIQVKR